MKKIILIFFAMFIIFAMTLPAFAATECEHVINYPAEVIDNSIEGLEVYACNNCNEKVWQCSNCHRAVSLEEIHCAECNNVRAAINSEEESLLKEERDSFILWFVIWISGIVIICTILFICVFI